MSNPTSPEGSAAPSSSKAPAAARPASPDLSELTGRVNLPPELLRASGMKRLDWIISQPEPAAFVGQLAPQELFYWMRDIGKEDAYVLLEYATQEQLQALVDIDAWQRHELQLPRWLEWLDLALAVDTDTAQRFLAAQDDETYLWLFSEGVEVLPADTDLDFIADDKAVFHTPDGMYVITVPRGHLLEERIPQLMRLLWSADMGRARAILQQVQFDLRSQNEEEMIRFRSARLMELGFEPPTEALEVYAYEPPAAAKAALRSELAAAAPSPIDGLAGVLSHQSFDPVLKGVSPPDLLRAALGGLSEAERLRVGDGLAYLANKVFMADVGDLSRIEDLPEYAARAIGFANLGLMYLSDEDEDTAARALGRVSVEHCFRVGHSLVFLQVRRARALARRAGRTLGFNVFDTPIDEVLEGLLLQRPLFAEVLDDERSLDFRPFTTTADLALTDTWLARAEAVLGWFETRFGFSPDALGAMEGISDDTRRRLRLDTLFRTGLANALVHDAFSFAPLGREDLSQFARMAFTKEGKAGPALAKLIEAAEDGDPSVQRFIERAVDVLTETLAGIKPVDIDGRYASDLFVVQKDGAGS